MKTTEFEANGSPTTSVSGADEARQAEGKSPIARQLNGVESGGTKSGNTTWYVSLDTEIQVPSPLAAYPAFAAISQPEKQNITADLRERSRANSSQELSASAQGKEHSPVAKNLVGVSNNDSLGPVAVSDGPAMEQEDVSVETVIKEVAVEKNAEDVGACLVADESDDPAPADGELEARFARLRSNTPWQREVDAGIENAVIDQNALADIDRKLDLLAAHEGLRGLDRLDEADGEIAIQEAAGKRLAPTGPPAGPAPGAAAGAPAGPAAAAQPAPSSVADNSTCASQFRADALKILFAQGGRGQAKPLSKMYAESNNAYAKLTVADFAEVFNVSLHKIQDDDDLSQEEKKSLLAELNNLAKKYISLIDSEGLDEKSAFGAFYLGHKTQRNQRLNLEGELVALSGGKNAEGRKTLQNLLILHTVRPFIDARLKEMFGGNPSGSTASLSEEMLNARAQEALDKIGDAAENYSKNHGASTRGLAFGFSLVTLWPELLRKLLDDETPAAAQAQKPAAAPAANAEPEQPEASSAPSSTPSVLLPPTDPSAASTPPEQNGGAGNTGVVINGNLIINDYSEHRSNYKNISNNNNERNLPGSDVTSWPNSINLDDDDALSTSSESESDFDVSDASGSRRRSGAVLPIELPVAEYAAAAPEEITPSITSANIIRMNGWQKKIGETTWKEEITETSRKNRSDVELTINRRLEHRSGGSKLGAPELPHPLDGSGWRKRAENKLMVEETSDAAKPVGQPDISSTVFRGKDGDRLYSQEKF